MDFTLVPGWAADKVNAHVDGSTFLMKNVEGAKVGGVVGTGVGIMTSAAAIGMAGTAMAPFVAAIGEASTAAMAAAAAESAAIGAAAPAALSGAAAVAAPAAAKVGPHVIQAGKKAGRMVGETALKNVLGPVLACTYLGGAYVGAAAQAAARNAKKLHEGGNVGAVDNSGIESADS